MEAEKHLLEIAQTYLRESIAPQAAAIDSDRSSLLAAFRGLGDRSLLGLRLPKIWGGPEFDELTFRTFQEAIARYSGALAFLQTQHQSAVRMLVNSENESLKQQYLPYVATGVGLGPRRSHRTLGIGFSQLRRPGEPSIEALPKLSGFILNGKVPWITGFSIFQEFIVAATLPDGSAVFGIVPFVESCQDTGGAIAFSEPMQLAAMTSTNTVSAQFTHWFLPQDRVVFIKPPGWIRDNDQKNVLNQTAFALGCARAGLDIVENTAKIKELSFISDAFEALNKELLSCRDRCYSPSTDPLQLRAWAIELSVRCAHAAITVSSGAANSQHHAAQRVYREALVFTVSAQTTAVMNATLNRLIRANF